MPRQNVNYEKTLIYKLVCNDLEVKEIYVGQTTNFRNRKDTHKRSCRNKKGKKYNLKVYQFIRANGGWESFSMIEIKKFPCTDSNEAKKRERYWIESLMATLNCQIPSRTQSEWILDNKEKIAEYHKNLYLANKEQIAEHHKNYNLANKEKLAEHSKIYREANKIKMAEKNKLVYLADRERRNEKSDCPCGGRYTQQNKLTHSKTMAHLAYLANIQSPPLAI
jgi:hypothetical protein